MPKFVLNAFPGGRSEAARICLTAAGVEWEEVTYNYPKYQVTINLDDAQPMPRLCCRMPSPSFIFSIPEPICTMNRTGKEG